MRAWTEINAAEIHTSVKQILVTPYFELCCCVAENTKEKKNEFDICLIQGSNSRRAFFSVMLYCSCHMYWFNFCTSCSRFLTSHVCAVQEKKKPDGNETSSGHPLALLTD